MNVFENDIVITLTLKQKLTPEQEAEVAGGTHEYQLRSELQDVPWVVDSKPRAQTLTLAHSDYSVLFGVALHLGALGAVVSNIAKNSGKVYLEIQKHASKPNVRQPLQYMVSGEEVA